MTREHYLGIDWSETKHDLCLENEKGVIVVEGAIEHSVQGFAGIENWREQLQLNPSEIIIGIESANLLLIDWLWAKNYEHVYVIPPSTVEKSRQRFHGSGAKDDRIDARELAELVRLERAHLLPWHPGSDRLQVLRAQVSFGLHLTKMAVMQANRLRSLLLRYYPAALMVCASWPTHLVCHLVQSYPDPQQLSRLPFAAFREFALAHGYPKPKTLLACFERLQASYPSARRAVSEALMPQAQYLAGTLLTTLVQKEANLRQLNATFADHPDAALFTALPGVGDWLAPALLVKFGEDRLRFPTPQLLQSLAGTCPVTEKSGKHQVVYFRRACDHEFRQIAQQWAHQAQTQSLWAQSYYHSLVKRGQDAPLATRCLANRLLAIAWRCWQDRKPYDEALHLQRRAQRSLPK